MSLPLSLDRRPADRPLQPLPGGPGGGLALVRARVHEICGPARRTLAAMVMGQSEGPVIWIFPGWLPERIYPDGLRDFADPARVVFARARRGEDILWAAEEALRSGAAPLVVADVAAIPPLTPVRRLNLAAEAGAEAAGHARRMPPLGLLLTPGPGGAAGAETRWRLAQAPSGSTLLERREAWRLDRLRARDAPPAAWGLLREENRPITVMPLPGAD